MNVIFDETYTSSDETQTSRNIWYGYADFSIDSISKEINSNDNLLDYLCKIITYDLSNSIPPRPTLTNWYFYGNKTTKDAIGDRIRPTIMVREKSGTFIVNFTISDFDFAMNIDLILSFKEALEHRLNDGKTLH